MSNFRKIIMLNRIDMFTGFVRDLITNPYRCNVSFNGMGYEIYYNGITLSVSTDVGRKFLNIQEGMASIGIKESSSLKPSIDRFVVPSLVHPFSLLWRYDCWSKRRITESAEKFQSIFEKIDPSKRIILTSKSMDLLYEERDGKFLRKAIRSKGPENFDDCKNLCKTIVDMKMNSPYPIGWDIDYISLENSIKYDLILDLPFYQPYDADGSIRKKLYKELLDTGKTSINISKASMDFFAKNKN